MYYNATIVSTEQYDFFFLENFAFIMFQFGNN